MGRIGPVAQLQSGRRGCWSLLSVPVALGGLMAAKARAWSLSVGGAAALVFFVFAAGAPSVGAAAFFGTALLVVGGAVGMTWLAVALACQAADLSDDHRPARGPGAIQRFLPARGLYDAGPSGRALCAASA